MDRHFRLAALHENAPTLAAFADLFYTQVRHAETRATFAYDERLRLLPPYLQQLEMESNGKGVTIEGAPVVRATARSEEHTSELQSLMRISYAVFCLNKKKHNNRTKH